MQIIIIDLTRIRINEANPREIRQEKFRKLVDSLLVFPKMLSVRPIVLDNTFKALGGNQRARALLEIAKMDIERIADRLCQISDYAEKTEGERKHLLEFWADWIESPTAHVIMADELTLDERKQFVIKDNVSYGAWDYDSLANNWDSVKLQNWGMDVWDDRPQASTNQDEEQDDEDYADAMPEELQGVNMKPDELPDIAGRDERPNDFVTISYNTEDIDKLLKVLGIRREMWTNKVSYTLDEIKHMREG